MYKACPVVIRNPAAPELLAFRHPRAGLQVVKGSIELGVTLHDACERELFEESGVRADAGRCPGQHTMPDGCVWGFVLMRVSADLPLLWSHYTSDGGGLIFRFFWHPLDASPCGEWDAGYAAAMQFLKSSLTKTSCLLAWCYWRLSLRDWTISQRS